MNSTTDAVQSSPPTLRFDIVAGLTAAAVVLPKAMAYATVAGLAGAQLGPERMLFNAHAAIERYQAMQATGGGMPPPGNT